MGSPTVVSGSDVTPGPCDAEELGAVEFVVVLVLADDVGCPDVGPSVPVEASPSPDGVESKVHPASARASPSLKLRP